MVIPSEYPSITENAVEQMVRSNEINTFRPFVQLIDVRTTGGAAGVGAGADRLRLILSDGKYRVTGMITSSSVPPDVIRQLQPDCIVQILKFIPKCVQGRMLIVVISLTVVHPSIGYRIRQNNEIDLQEIQASGLIEDVIAQHSNGTVGVVPAPARPLYSNSNATTSNLMNSSSMVTNHNKPGMMSNTIPDHSRSNPYIGSSGGISNQAGASNPYGYNSNVKSNSNAPIVRSSAMANSSHITPISALNMYNNRWTIMARVVSKSDIKTWSNSRGEGSLFSVELLDGSGTDIRATFFKEAVDKFYSTLNVSSVYTFTGGRLKVANMQYNTCKSSFEITFDQNAEIHLQPDSGNIQHQNYDFIPNISSIEGIDANSNIDVLAIVKHVGDVTRLMSKKTGQELVKCDMVLIDDSNTEITFTVWGNQAEKAAALYAGFPVVAIRRARVSDYNGKSLGSGGAVEVNPMHLPQANALATWWETVGSNVGIGGRTSTAKSLSGVGGGLGKIESLSERIDIAQIKDQNLGYKPDNKADYVTFKGICTFIKKDKDGGAWYPACPNSNDPCRNLYKVTQGTDGRWFCEKCQNSYPKPFRRWIFTGVVEDHSGSTWVSFFDEQAQVLLGGVTADEAYDKSYSSEYGDGSFDGDAYDSIFAKAIGTEAIFRCKVKNEMYGDAGESRVKTSVVKMVLPIDYVKEANDMLQSLQPQPIKTISSLRQ